MGLRVVPGGCTSVRQTIGDILSTANVVTAAATQTKSLPRILGEPRQRTTTDGGPNEIAPGPNLIRVRRDGTAANGGGGGGKKGGVVGV